MGTDDRRVASRGSLTHGFLFADLRNYSAYVEANGDRAAAELLQRYRSLVRVAADEFHGSEILTEGDSFYIAFDSTSAALECGLRILALAVEGEQPIEVGIGVHAGETVEIDEGYVGSAVNIAARICSVAAAGELLASDTVRGLTRTYLAVDFAARGRRRLKGISEPVSLYQVVPKGTVLPLHRGRRRLVAVTGAAAGFGIIAAGFIIAVALVGGGPTSDGVGVQPSPTPGSSRTASAAVAGESMLEPTLPTDPPALSQPFPNPAEAELLLLVDAIHRPGCERSLVRDAPAMRLPPHPGQDVPTWVSASIAYQGTITCRLGSTAPDTLWLWHVEPATIPPVPDGLTVTPVEVVRNRGGQLGIGAPGGDCATDALALEDWTFGTTRGLLLCYERADGQAVLEWGYRGHAVLGKATRTDGDLPALVAWWTRTARFPP